jgi:lambda family phage tail tape measure protein
MQSLADSTNWADGMKLAWYKYVDETMNAARLSEQAFTKAAHGIEDSLTNAVMHGEFSLRKLGEMVCQATRKIVHDDT